MFFLDFYLYRTQIRHNPEIHDIISSLWRRCTPVQRVDKLRIPIGHFIAIVIGLCVSAVPIVRSYPTAVWQLDEVASGASVLATVRVEHTIRGSSLSGRPIAPLLAALSLLSYGLFLRPRYFRTNTSNWNTSSYPTETHPGMGQTCRRSNPVQSLWCL